MTSTPKGQKDASPGGTFIIVRRFLGRNLETYEKQRKNG